MKNIICFFALLFATYSISQTKLYVHPDGDRYAFNTQTIAILPLRTQVKLRPKELKDFSPEQIVQMGKDEALDIQKGMHTWFLKRKQRGQFQAKIQSPNQSNALLRKAGVDIHDLDLYTAQELGQILEVDCIIMGSFETSKPMSGAASLGLALLTGGFGATSSATCNMDFYDTRDGELVVNYLKGIKGSLGSNSQDLINILMRKVTRRIPYTK
tara:strand:+ start:280 stop:918 length:639 start_codon:yes stop_codon:yes gene_type:complete